MGVTVAFDYATWVARYPEFSGVTEPVATLYFTEATVYHANDGTGPVNSAALQALYLNALTAHIAKRNTPATAGAAPSALNGPITNASEGSVSVAVDSAAKTGTEQWYKSTQYGFDYWNMTSQYRTAKYILPLRARMKGRL